MNIKELLSLDIQVNKEDGVAEIKGTVPSSEIEKKKEIVLKQIAKNKKIDGFREGNVPVDVVEKEVGALEIWRSAAYEVIMEHLPSVLVEDSLTPLDQPKINITNSAIDANVEFTVDFNLLPEINLPDLSTINVINTAKAEEASDEEVDAVFLDLRRAKYKRAHPEKEPPSDPKELPEIDEAFLKEISPDTEDVESFKKKIRENISKEKEFQSKQMFRNSIMDAILEKTEINIPKSVIDEETQRGRSEVQAHAETLQTTIEEFLKKQNMTEEAFMNQLREEAEKRAKVQLVLNVIASQENITADQELVEKEFGRFEGKQHGMSEDQLKMYLNAVLTNEAVMNWLEMKYTK